MPYVKQQIREEFKGTLLPLLDQVVLRRASAGDLDYLITMLTLAWLGQQPDFAAFVTARGVLQDVSDELRRRSMVNYEDRKIRNNGDLPFPYASHTPAWDANR